MGAPAADDDDVPALFPVLVKAGLAMAAVVMTVRMFSGKKQGDPSPNDLSTRGRSKLGCGATSRRKVKRRLESRF